MLVDTVIPIHLIFKNLVFLKSLPCLQSFVFPRSKFSSCGSWLNISALFHSSCSHFFCVCPFSQRLHVVTCSLLKNFQADLHLYLSYTDLCECFQQSISHYTAVIWLSLNNQNEDHLITYKLFITLAICHTSENWHFSF